MTRSVEDSDADFPELEDLLKESREESKARNQRSTSSRPLSTMPIRDASRDALIGSPYNRENRHVKSGKPLMDREKEVEVKARPKKRVLGRKMDNPLLRPLSAVNTVRRSVSVDLTRNTPGIKQSKPDEDSGLQDADHSTGSPVATRNSQGEKSAEIQRKSLNEKRSARTQGRRRRVPSLRLEPKESAPKEDSDGLSDFIVNDSSLMEDSVVEITPPKSTRKLVRGRKRQVKEKWENEDLNAQMKSLLVEDGEVSASTRKPKSSLPKKLPPKSRAEDSHGEIKKTSMPARSPDLDSPFSPSLSVSETTPKKSSREASFATPTSSPEPKPKSLVSPKKLPRLPATPHRPSMDSFWQQDVINDWNDEYSPRKTLKPTIPLKLEDDAHLSNGTLLFSPTKKSPVKAANREAKEAKKLFSQRKNALAEAFLKELDEKITKGQITKLAEATGGVKIIWSKKLNSTAGRANWKRETLKSSTLSSDGKPQPTVTYRHHAAIELAEKVIDDEDRLINVIAHEFCHLANFMISNIKTNPHGKEFKSWAAKCGKVFGGRGVEVTTKHSYNIDYKYVWECVNCGLEFKRHSKSIDPKRHQCGSCKSKLVQTKPVPKKGDGEVKAMGEYQLFVKDNMKKVREENPGSPQKEIMGLVGKKYQEEKARRLLVKADEKGDNSVVGVKEMGGSKEGTPDDEGIADVARKLVFLDLTSNP